MALISEQVPWKLKFILDDNLDMKNKTAFRPSQVFLTGKAHSRYRPEPLGESDYITTQELMQ